MLSKDAANARLLVVGPSRAAGGGGAQGVHQACAPPAPPQPLDVQALTVHCPLVSLSTPLTVTSNTMSSKEEAYVLPGVTKVCVSRGGFQSGDRTPFLQLVSPGAWLRDPEGGERSPDPSLPATPSSCVYRKALAAP